MRRALVQARAGTLPGTPVLFSRTAFFPGLWLVCPVPGSQVSKRIIIDRGAPVLDAVPDIRQAFANQVAVRG